jgi:hypothetical protein
VSHHAFAVAFALLLAISVTVFWTPLRRIAVLSWSDDRYSHLLLIPMISAFLLYFERVRIFSPLTDRHGAAFSLLLATTTVYALSALTPLGVSNRLAGMMLSVVLVWAGTFALCIGMPSFRRGFRFQVPGLEIEIASECSGIRSTFALKLVSMLARYHPPPLPL